MDATGIPMGFADERVRGCHVCMIFDGDAQRRGIVADFAAGGIRCGERVRYFADRAPPDTIREWVTERGVEVPAAEARGAFAVLGAEAVYCAGGRHDPAATIAAVKRGYVVAEEGGFSASRVLAEMSWALRGLPGSERFLEYEMMLNQIDVAFPHSGMCQYDSRLFDGATLFKVLQVHPFVVAQGQIVENPYYVKPGAPPVR